MQAGGVGPRPSGAGLKSWGARRELRALPLRASTRSQGQQPAEGLSPPPGSRSYLLPGALCRVRCSRRPGRTARRRPCPPASPCCAGSCAKCAGVRLQSPHQPGRGDGRRGPLDSQPPAGSCHPHAWWGGGADFLPSCYTAWPRSAEELVKGDQTRDWGQVLRPRGPLSCGKQAAASLCTFTE